MDAADDAADAAGGEMLASVDDSLLRARLLMARDCSFRSWSRRRRGRQGGGGRGLGGGEGGLRCRGGRGKGAGVL